MSESALPIGAEVVKAAGRAFTEEGPDEHGRFFEAGIEAAIRAADKARGLREEGKACSRCDGHGTLFNGGWARTPCANCGGNGRSQRTRLVSDWRPVDEEPAEDPCLCRKAGDSGEDCPWKCPRPSASVRVDGESSA